MSQYSQSARQQEDLETEVRLLRRQAKFLRALGVPIAGVLVLLGAPFMLAGWASSKALDLLQAVAGRTAHPLLRGARNARDHANGLLYAQGADAEAVDDTWQEWPDVEYADQADDEQQQYGAEGYYPEYDDQAYQQR